MNNVFAVESSSLYFNALSATQMLYINPYAKLKMAAPLDLHRVRHCEPKYLILGLFTKKYPEISVPNKVPMPCSVDEYFKTWHDLNRQNFRNDIRVNKFTGYQKWQMWCLERFLNT